MKLILYSNKNCDTCNRITKTLINKPPKCNVIIKDCTDSNIHNSIWEAEQKGVTELPCAILYADNDETIEVRRWIGLFRINTINRTIDNYEYKRLV